MTAQHPIRSAMMACSLPILALVPGLPAAAAPRPDETPIRPPWFPETLSAGGGHACGVRSDGTLACWGLNQNGQATPPSGAFTQVSAGSNLACGLRSDYTVACWGSNGYGQATPPAGLFTQVSAGSEHTCGMRAEGYWVCWGWNDYGQLNGNRTFLPLAVGN